MGDIPVAIATEVVKFMLVGLKEVIHEQAHLISDSKKQLDELESNMLLLKDFQADYTKLSEKNILIKDLLRNIRDRVYEAEDAVDNFISSVQGKNFIQRTFNPVKFRDMAERIQSIGKKVNELCTKVKEHIQNNTTTQD